MRGYIVNRNKTPGSYTIVLNLGKDSTGKFRQSWTTVKGTKKDAEKRLSELLHQLDTGLYMRPGKDTLSNYLDRWLIEYARPNLSPRTVEGYSTIIERHLKPKLGNILLTELRPEHIQRYYSEMLSDGRTKGGGGLNSVTVRQHSMVLHRALELATKWGLLMRNPADSVDPPRIQRHEMRFMLEEQIHTILEAAKRTEYYPVFFLFLYTGMRRSELLALRWCDIDLLLGQISVSRTLHQLRDKTFVYRSPKTAKGRRTIALPPSAIMVLKEYKTIQQSLRLTLGAPIGENDLVFSQLDGSPLLPGTITQAWRRLAHRVGLNGVRLHDCRHSHASLLLKQGVHPKIVQERLGHANIGITLDTYSHVAPGLQEAAALRFDEALSANWNNEPANNPH